MARAVGRGRRFTVINPGEWHAWLLMFLIAKFN